MAKTHLGAIRTFAAGHLIAACALMLPATAMGEGARMAKDEIAIEDIVSALERREREVRSAKFVFTEEYAYPRGSLTQPGFEGPVPPEDSIVRQRVTLWIDGAKIRRDEEGTVWSYDQGKFCAQQYSSASDGQLSKSLFSGESMQEQPEGTIHDTTECIDAPILNHKPILGLYRGTRYLLRSEAGRGADEWVLSGCDEVDGIECVVLKKADARGRETWCCLALERDFSLVRYSQSYKGRLSRRIDVRHRQDPRHGWVPVSWEINAIRSADGGLKWSIAATVDDYWINPAIDPEVFDLRFPVGTVVRDARSPHSQRYTVREDGTKGPAPGRAPQAHPSTWLLWAAALVGLLLVILAVWSRRRMRSAPGKCAGRDSEAS